MGDIRIVKVDIDFYVKLVEYLQPEERFRPPTEECEMGLILYVPLVQRQLIFVIDKEKP